MDCPHWDELRFIKHCQGELPPQEEDQFQQHLHICTDCREYANISWEVMLNVPTTEESAEIERDTEAFLKSKTWQECKERLIKRHTQVPNKPRNTKDVKRPADTGINPIINSLLGINLNARHDDVDTETAIQIEKDTQEFLHSKVWKEHKQKLIQHLANNTLEQHVEERSRQRAEQVVEQQQPEHSEQPTVEMPAPTNVNVVAFPEEKIQAPKASSLRYQTIMKAAAMVIMVITPALLTYHLLIRPYYEKQAGNTRVLATNIVETTDLKTLAEAFESANARLKEDPQDADALFVRAVSSEKLSLLETTKNDYQQYLAIEKTSNRSIEVAQRLKLLSERLSISTAQKPTRYEQLDRYINDYLSALQAGNNVGAMSALTNADNIANEMLNETNEHFGLDLVSFYRTVPIAAIEKLREARKIRAEIDTTVVADHFKEALTQAYRVKDIFSSYNSACEIERTDVQIVKYLNKMDAISDAQNLLQNTLDRTIEHRHLFLQADLLRWKGELLSNTSEFDKAIEVLEESIRIAKPLNVPNFLIKPSLILATIYYVVNDNEHAFQQAHTTLNACLATNSPVPIQILQVLGVSAFNLNSPSLAELYLQHSISLAQKQGNYSYLSLSYAFSGILQAEQNHATKAQERFTKASQSLAQIADNSARSRVEFAVVGYQARAQMLAGQTDKAIELYQRAIDLGKQTNVQQMLSLSQLHQGMGECLMAKGDKDRARIELETAVAFDHKAREGLEQNNAFLTFAVTRKSSQQQLDTLE
ncbi:MAG: tetratricopeptide repeat protein [Acidobacteriota bacterium]